ncbi:hypothetical protein BDZ89DRAFT_1057090, partial [Hymenopellis radicata]
MERHSTQPECTVCTLKERLSVRCPSNIHILDGCPVFDYLLTLEQEVDLIWGSEWTITKLLYLITRYSPFVNVVLFLWFTPNMSAENCLLIYRMNGWMAAAGVVLAEVILTLRTWAVWNRHRFLTVCMPALFFAYSVVVFTVMGIFQNSLQFSILPLPDPKGCFISAAKPIYRITAVPNTATLYSPAPVMLLLMVVKSYQQFREAREIGSSQLLNVILKDGVIYYLYLSVLNITNVIAISSLAVRCLSLPLCIVLERVIHAMLACRVITNIRSQAKKQVIHGSKGTIGDLGTSVGAVAFAAHDSTDSLE